MKYDVYAALCGCGLGFARSPCVFQSTSFFKHRASHPRIRFLSQTFLRSYQISVGFCNFPFLFHEFSFIDGKEFVPTCYPFKSLPRQHWVCCLMRFRPGFYAFFMWDTDILLLNAWTLHTDENIYIYIYA